MLQALKALTWPFFGYVVALHLFLTALIVKTDAIPKVRIELEISPATTPHFTNMVRYHGWMDASVPDNATIFLGDSIVQGLATTAVAPKSVNYGIGGETTAQLLEAIPSYKSLDRAGAIVLAIGINFISHGMASGLGKRFEKITEALPQKPTLIWSAVMPAKYSNVAPSEIASANQTIKALCAKRGNCAYLDTWRILADNKGEQIAPLFLKDGLHLSPEGYEVWIGALKKALEGSAATNQQPI